MSMNINENVGNQENDIITFNAIGGDKGVDLSSDSVTVMDLPTGMEEHKEVVALNGDEGNPKGGIAAGNEEDGQLSLFNFDSVIGPSSFGKKDNGGIDSCKPESKPTSSRKTEVKSGKGGSRTTAPVTPQKPKLESVKLGEGWRIHYAAQSFDVDVMFADDIAACKESVSIEEIRLKLVIEEDAGELTPSGTKWIYDEDQKKLYPDAWGQDKGAR